MFSPMKRKSHKSIEAGDSYNFQLYISENQ